MTEREPKAIVIEERTCGWCGQALENQQPTAHALTCKDQPYQVFKQRLRAELVSRQLAYAGNGILPRWIEESIRTAEEATQIHIIRKGWRYTD